jgi:LPS-assembly lipoprotein
MSIRNISLTLITLLVAACGFTPMYGNLGAGTDVPSNLDRVEIAMIPNESGIFLRNELIDRFYRGGYPSSPTHRLVISEINEQIRDLDITIESEATRKQIKLTITMTMSNLTTGQSDFSRQLTAITSYNVSPTQFTTRISEADAREAALRDLARQIETQSSLYFKR